MSTTQRLSYQEVKQRIESVDGYKLLSKEYQNKKQKLKIQCSQGHVFKTTIHHFKVALVKCPICRKEQPINFYDTTLSYETVKQRIESDPGFKLISKEYIHCTTQRLEIQCPEGHIFDRPLTVWKRNGNNNCPVCNKSTLLKYEDVKNAIESKAGFKLISSEYWHSQKQKLDIQCPNGHIFQRDYHHWIGGSQDCMQNGCSYHTHKSTGEEYIEEWLRANGIDFIREHCFDNCRGKKRALPFDFFLPDHNLLIEFDGAYHYMQVNGRGNLEHRKAYDKIRNKYCHKQGINLLRIPYWKLNQKGEMDRILTEALNTTVVHNQTFDCDALFACVN